MAGEDDDVIVALSGDTSTTNVKIEPAAGGSVDFNNEDGDPVADLKAQFTQISGRLQTVVADQQQTAQQLHDTTQRLQRAESQVVVSQIDTVENGIAQVDADAAAAERAYATAFEAGDGMAMARAQRAMTQSAVDRSKLIEAKQSLQEAAKRGPQQQRENPVRRVAADPVEAVAAGMTPQSAAWIRAHPDCITDPKKNARMMAAHNLAIADDVAVDTPEYFERIEAGIKQVVKKVDPKPAEGGDGRRPSSGAASGGAAGGALNGGATTVKLTRGEADSATDGTIVWNYPDPTGGNRWQKGDPIGLAEMARRKHEGQKAGLYDRNS